MNTLDHIENPLQLIDLAIKDVSAIAEDKRYELNMDHWHFACKTKCYVCMAGAVMAGTLEADIEHDLSPCNTVDDTMNKLRLINHWRCGWSGELRLIKGWRIWVSSLDGAFLSIRNDIVKFNNGNLEVWAKFRNNLEANATAEGLI